jgi:K+-sensing histidine kinase KdpD
MTTLTSQALHAPARALGITASPQRLADPRWLVLSGSLAWLIMSATVLRPTVAMAAGHVADLGVFVVIAVVVGFMAEDATRRTRQADRAAEAAQRIAEADRMRTVLLATVSHDLRTPLAAAKAAVGCLRSRDVQLTAGSSLTLRASAAASRVQLRVIDRGPGIPEADRDRAFLPFHRLGDTSNTTGVGLGLAVARGLTEAMGGMLEAEETPGGGLTMAISLPAAPRPR